MIKFGGEIKIRSMLPFMDINLVIDEMVNLNNKCNYFDNDNIIKFCKFSIANGTFSNSEIFFTLHKNEYDEFYSVEDEIYDLNFENENLVKEKLINTNQMIDFKIKADTLNNYQLCLLFSVALANKVEGIVDLIAYPKDEVISLTKKFTPNDWKVFVFQKLKMT
jgi:hypothetical protein